ncbi:MAG TPA: tyrosinase family protein [Candidatus Polarisedimenticolia bacterium]|nr:tyrosinase family protein [Candidatus Polarisedimenticolia bacterium]
MRVIGLTRLCFLFCLAVIATACAQKITTHSDRMELPKEAVPLYDEVAAFRAPAAGRSGAAVGTTKLRLDLAFLIRDSKPSRVVVAPFDDDNWYEPAEARLEGSMATVEVDPSKNFLVALDLGDGARGGYQAMVQLGAAGGLIPGALKPKLCQLILCSPDAFPLSEIGRRLPEVDDLPFEIGNVVPPIPVGAVGRGGTVCEDCFERGPSIIPCVLHKWCGPFPIPRRVRIRRNIYSLSTAEVAKLQAGVAVMKARAATDPTSWWYQAKMHATNSAALPLQDQCQHRQFLFFSWHRMFVYFFERILRKAVGDPDFAQPYWNYTDVAAQRVIPEPYRLPANASTNALYNSSRAAVYNGGAGLPAADVSYSAGFNLTNFTTSSSSVPSFGGLTVGGPQHFPSGGWSGRIEMSPHNNVHNDISGEMASGESPRDPIFWLHHSNIDRLWKRWLLLGNGRANPTGDTVWMNHVFTFFDENGTQQSLTGAQVLYTVSQLGYRYDDEPYVIWPLVQGPLMMAVPRKPGPPEPLGSIKRQVRLEAGRADVTLSLPERGRAGIASALKASAGGERLILQVSEIRYDAPVGLTYLLFLNLPAGDRNPGPAHPGFIGTLGFFGGDHHAAGAGEGLSVEYDITRVARRIGLSGDLVISALPSLPEVPEDRKDLQALRDRMRPEGHPSFGQVTLSRVRFD